ncbi:hypothetical protein ULG90_03180 [Halopseudomonas pachastrellae]|nr:hypothetical protein ULG90_03180 [Halopseudomonas pachastrellae]
MVRPHATGAAAVCRGLRPGPPGAAGAEQGLLELLANESQPAIARATAASMLQSWPGPEVAQSLFVALRADDPQIRLGALQAVSSYPSDHALATG